MNNIDYLSYGYNLLKGNPLEDADPGFTGQSIFDFKYDNKETTTDRRFEVPDNVDIRMVKQCTLSISYQAIFGETSLYKAMQ